MEAEVHPRYGAPFYSVTDTVKIGTSARVRRMALDRFPLFDKQTVNSNEDVKVPDVYRAPEKIGKRL